MRGPLQIVTSEKDFARPWVGSPVLNRMGLHPVRMVLSDLCLRLRRLQRRPLGRPSQAGMLERDGVVVVHDLLPAAVFDVLRAEVMERLGELRERVPLPGAKGRGFDRPQPFEGGFDRYDGNTLNRFVTIDANRTPHAAAFSRDRGVGRLAGWAAGFRPQSSRWWIYENVFGDERSNPDVQKHIHRDTFHSTVKAWFFVEDVRPEDGPFGYVISSHRATWARLRWEYRRANKACAPETRVRGGSFRARPADLEAMGLPQPRFFPVPANTLLLADVRGFHRRGTAPAGARRVALYASLRQWAFSPVAF